MPISKNAYKRYLIIHNALKRPPKIASKEKIRQILDDEGYGISESMLEKDLETMRSKFDLPVIYDRNRRGYCYENPDVSFDIPLDDDAIRTIYSALNQLELFQDTSIFKNTKASLDKIRTRLDIDLRSGGSNMDNIIFFEPQPGFAGQKWVAPIYDAIVERRIISFSFRKLDIVTDHSIEPYALKEFSGRWYVLGHDEKHKIAVFGLDRMLDLIVTLRHFVFDSEFKHKLDRKIKLSIGELNFGSRSHQVVIAYDREVAEEIISYPINDSQWVQDSDDIVVIIRVNANINEEFVRKAILPYADKVEVLGPPFVVDLVLRVIKKILDKYTHYIQEREDHNGRISKDGFK